MICGAYIEVKAAAEDKRGSVPKTAGTKELDANVVASEEGLAHGKLTRGVWVHVT